MKRRIASLAFVLGLLPAVVMVCATLAQSPEPPQSVTPSPVQNVPYVAPSQTYPNIPPGSPQPSGGSPYPFISNSPYTPRAIGLYQAVACNNQIMLIDTSSGECWNLNDGSWVKAAPPIAETQRYDRERVEKSIDSERRNLCIWPAKD
jgi:hypothetical protein